MISIPQFINFCNQEFWLFHRARRLRDGRKAPQIKAPSIFTSIFFMPVLQLRSFLQLDQCFRLHFVRKFFGTKLSDTTLDRSLRGFKLEPLRDILHSTYLIGRMKGFCSLYLGSRKLRIGVIDGSKFGHFFASAFQVLGKVNLWLNLKVIPKWGKELPISKELLRELKVEFEEGFIDIILGDGLYVDKDFFNLCKKELKAEAVIKTTEESLNIIQDAKGLFLSENFREEIEYREGVDEERLCHYKVYCCGGFYHEGVDFPLKVAFVQEDYLKEDKKEEFYVVST
jgi:hypothetical protein